MKTNQLLFFLGCFLIGGLCPLFSQNQPSELWKVLPQKTGVLISKPLSAGWTWFSLNVTGPDMSVTNVIGSLDPQDGDYIKNQTVSATYYEGSGWFGELTVIDPKEMYKIKLSQAGTLTFTGDPVDPGTNPIPIKNGWNWIGYLPQSALTITEALSTIVPVAEDYIKNQTKSSTFYEGPGWFGEMTNLEPLDGYMLKTNHTGTLTFPEPSSGTFTDTRDGKTYPWIKIGNQKWMAQNLAYLPAVSPSSSGSETNAYFYVYGYDGTDVGVAKANVNFTIYGVLYNWPAVMNGYSSSTLVPSGVNGACPDGWHLPSDAEWTILTEFLGTSAGGKMKETETIHWRTPNTGATNESGFTAIPGGYRDYSGAFIHLGTNSDFWSSTEDGTSSAWDRDLTNNGDDVSRYNDSRSYGFSVRCVLGQVDILATITTADITEITEKSASCGGTIINDGGAAISANGVCWNTTGTPTIADFKTTDVIGIGTFTSNLTRLLGNTYYFVRAYATNSVGSAYGEEKQFTTFSEGSFIDSRDGHVYKYKAIGMQTWMTENLAYLPEVSPSSAGAEYDPNYYVYGYEGSRVMDAKAVPNYATYGVLYNYPAALTACPSGWHLPTDEEWKVLEKNQGMSQSDANADGWRNSGTVGGKLKEAGTSHWYSPNTGATNSSCFTAVPGGYRYYDGGFYSLGRYAGFWAASGSNPFVYGRDLDYFHDGVRRDSYLMHRYGFSARCLQN